MKLKFKTKRIVAVIIIACLLASTVLSITVGSRSNSNSNTVSMPKGLTEAEKQTVNDISNMTGATSQEIIKLKSSGKTWNEILNILKSKGAVSQQDMVSKSNLLADSNLGEDFVNKLKVEGYKNEEITAARMLVERVVYQLQEITDSSGVDITSQTKNNSEDKKSDDISAFKELQGKIDLKTAVSLMLKLKNDFGSIDKVLDEYLYSLQLGINLEDYINDKDGYQKQRKDKGAGVDLSNIITIVKIEEKMLEVIQKRNENSKNKSDITQNITDGSSTNESIKGKTDLSSSPIPDVKNSKPLSPGTDIMKEVQDIQNKALSPN